MPSQFTPSAAEEVKEKVKKMPATNDVSPCGPGLLVVEKRDAGHYVHNWHGLASESGWRVDKRIQKDSGDSVILMPITEVPNE